VLAAEPSSNFTIDRINGLPFIDKKWNDYLLDGLKLAGCRLWAEVIPIGLICSPLVVTPESASRLSGVFKPQKIPDNAFGISGMTPAGSKRIW
jgi:hypothetical protein